MTSTAQAITEQVCVTVRTRCREVLYPIAGKSAVLTDTFRVPRHVIFGLSFAGHRAAGTDSVLK